MNNRLLMLEQLNEELKEWQLLSEKYPRPRRGWIKTLRIALDMTGEQLANRLGVKRARIAQLERAEIQDAVTLRSLKKVAATLNCDLVYVIAPKKSLSLKNIRKAKAEEVAAKQITRVAHSMSLEAQSTSRAQLKKQKAHLVRKIFEKFDKKLWEEKKNGLEKNEIKIKKHRQPK